MLEADVDIVSLLAQGGEKLLELLRLLRADQLLLDGGWALSWL